MFSKIDKKVLIVSGAIIVAILLVVFAVYKYSANSGTEVQNITGGAQTEVQSPTDQSSNIPQVQIEAGGIQTEGGSGQGMLTVCMDKCGDGVCQETDPNCGENSNLNCVCPETPQECPQDCE